MIQRAGAIESDPVVAVSNSKFGRINFSQDCTRKRNVEYINKSITTNASSADSSANKAETAAPVSKRKCTQDIDKDAILHKYSKFCEAKGCQLPVVTSNKGKQISSNVSNNIPSNYSIIRNSKMKPSADLQYRVKTLSIENVLPTIIKDYEAYSLDKNDIRRLTCVNKLFRKMIPDIIRLRDLEFSDLTAPRYDYSSQTEISQQRVDMATAAMIQFGMDPGMLVRYMSGEYTGATRNVEQVERDIGQYIEQDDMDHIKRILTSGCPAQLVFEEEAENKNKLIARGNQKSFDMHPEHVKKTLNKEEKNSHLIPVKDWVVRASPSCRHNSQGLNLKKPESPRVVWDQSTKLEPSDVVLNEITSIDLEAAITFGDTKMKLYKEIYNLRVSHPDQVILLATADIKACFRYPRIAADLTGAFAFVAQDLLFLATSMVFGSNTSCPSWEPFRRAIEAMAIVLHDKEGLVEKHKRLLDMLVWETTVVTEEGLTKAVRCEINKGVLDDNSREKPTPLYIYVDDALIACIGINNMRKALAACIEAIFIVMGKPNVAVRQMHLAMDKWEGAKVGPQQVILGLEINTNTLEVGTTIEYQTEVRELIYELYIKRKNNTSNACTFNVSSMHKLVGKIARLGEGAHWIYKLLSHMYTSITYALSKNKALLSESSNEFKKLVQQIKTKQFTIRMADTAKQVNFAMKKAARMVHRCNYKYIINETLRDELEFIYQALDPQSEISFRSPIAHIIPRTPTGSMFGDSSLRGCGGYSSKFSFWWHLEFPEDIQARTLLHRQDNEDGLLISINCLEYVTVIINYCATLVALSTSNITDDPYPVILSITDNTSAMNWTTHTSKKSQIGRALARFFCGLMINSNLGINSKWIATDENEVADGISRIKKSISNNSTHSFYDYSSLKADFHQLKNCSFFQPSRELLFMIWNILLTKKCPSLDQVIRLKPSDLGKLVI